MEILEWFKHLKSQVGKVNEDYEISIGITFKEIGRIILQIAKIIIVKFSGQCLPVTETHIDILYELFGEDPIFEEKFYKLFSYEEIGDNEKKKCLPQEL